MRSDGSPGTSRVMVRLPDQVRESVSDRASANRRSLSSEVLVLIERGLAAEAAPGQP